MRDRTESERSNYFSINLLDLQSSKKIIQILFRDTVINARAAVTRLEQRIEKKKNNKKTTTTKKKNQALSGNRAHSLIFFQVSVPVVLRPPSR